MATAQCVCGSLYVQLQGEPVAVVACHCIACQRRTGSPFAVSAYYPTERTKVFGQTKRYVRTADSGQPVKTHFCPTCGSAVYWDAGKHSGMVCVAVGAFADPDFPPPDLSVWERTKHRWVHIPTASGHFPEERP